MAKFSTRSERTRALAKSQAAIARLPKGATPMMRNKDKIILSQASIKNTMLANRQAAKEKAKRSKAQNTDSNN